MPLIARLVAFVVAAVIGLGGLTGPPVSLLLALIPLLAGIGIVRKTVWSAYGFALYVLVQVPIFLWGLLKPGHPSGLLWVTPISAAFSVALSFLFFRAGRKLSEARDTSLDSRYWGFIASKLSHRPERRHKARLLMG